MKKLPILALCLSAFAFNANATTVESKTTIELSSSQSTSTTNISSVNSTETAPTLVNEVSANKKKKESKSWDDRTLAGKILIGTGVGVFVVLCVLFGTVSVG